MCNCVVAKVVNTFFHNLKLYKKDNFMSTMNLTKEQWNLLEQLGMYMNRYRNNCFKQGEVVSKKESERRVGL